MRDAVSSLDIEESYFSKNILFFYKNDFSFYYLKLKMPSIPLILVFEDLFCSSILFLQKERKRKEWQQWQNGQSMLCCNSHFYRKVKMEGQCIKMNQFAKSVL